MIRVILVDKHTFFRRALRRRLESFELAVIAGEAENGQEAIALIDSTSPDLVLMEIELSGMDGTEIGNLVKQKHPDIAVALYTLLESVSIGEDFYDSADYCLSKEALFDSLVGIISKIEMGKRSPEREIRPA